MAGSVIVITHFTPFVQTLSWDWLLLSPTGRGFLRASTYENEIIQTIKLRIDLPESDYLWNLGQLCIFWPRLLRSSAKIYYIWPIRYAPRPNKYFGLVMCSSAKKYIVVPLSNKVSLYREVNI